MQLTVKKFVNALAKEDLASAKELLKQAIDEKVRKKMATIIKEKKD